MRILLEANVTSSGTLGLMGNVVLANTPQLVLSLLYFTHNGLVTSLCLPSLWAPSSETEKASGSRPTLSVPSARGTFSSCHIDSASLCWPFP